MGALDDLISGFTPGSSPDSIAAMTPAQQQPFALNAVAGSLESFGGFMGAMSHVMYGLQAQRAASYQSQQLRTEAGQDEASAERQSFLVGRQTQLVTSRALAVAAASGGGASDPTVVNMIARDAGQGAYQQAVALYQGQDRARLLMAQAAAKDYQGKEEAANSDLVGAGQAVGGVASILRSQARGASLYDRFSGGGAPTIPDLGG